MFIVRRVPDAEGSRGRECRLRVTKRGKDIKLRVTVIKDEVKADVTRNFQHLQIHCSDHYITPPLTLHLLLKAQAHHYVLSVTWSRSR